MSLALPLGRFNVLPLYDAIASVDSWSSHVMVRISNTAFRKLKYYWSQLQWSQCVADWDATSPQELLFTDASDFGAGAHLQQVHPRTLVSGVFNAVDAN